MTIFAKTDHSMQFLDLEILVPHCSTRIALCNGEVGIGIAHTVPASRYERLRNEFQQEQGFSVKGNFCSVPLSV